MIFLRHAKQKYDPQIKEYQDYGLTSVGIEQANTAAQKLANKYGEKLKGGIIYSSPLERAKETSFIVQKQLGGTWIHHLDKRLEERRYHENESLEALFQRANSFYQFILENKEKPTIVICHGQWYKVLAAFHNFNILRLEHAEYVDLNETNCNLKAKL